MEKEEKAARNWLELPEDIIIMILQKLGAIEILYSAQRVCSLWFKICKDPSLWRIIHMYFFYKPGQYSDLNEKICRHAIDLSCGGLLDIYLKGIGSDDLLQYIVTQSSNQLKRIRLYCCYDITKSGLVEALSKLPLLEHLDIFYTDFDTDITLETVGRCCPLLKTLKLNYKYYGTNDECDEDEEALAIAKHSPNLHHLQIIYNALTNKGLQAILDACFNLVSLDLRFCINLEMNDQLVSRCAERIKNLLLPDDPLNDMEFRPIFY